MCARETRGCVLQERMQAIAAWMNLGGHAVTCVECTLAV
jgi:hypothetical protein